MTIEIRLLGASDAHVLDRVADDVFDDDIDPAACAAFFADSRHHIAVALDDDDVVGIASSLHYVHPDKPGEYFINEIGVAPTHQRRGIGRRLIDALLDHARGLQCTEAWVATEDDNEPARALYAAAGGRGQSCVYFTFDLKGDPT